MTMKLRTSGWTLIVAGALFYLAAIAWDAHDLHVKALACTKEAK